MPNHVRNKITIFAKEDRRKEVLNFVTKKDEKPGPDDDGEFYITFENIIPKPEGTDLNGAEANQFASFFSSRAGGGIFNTASLYSMERFKEKLSKLEDGNYSTIDGQLENIKKIMKNFVVCGHPTWYEWNVENWQTKWDAYSQNNRNHILEFNTAWGHPRIIVSTLAKKFPDVSFEVMYADEDIGNNLGHYKIKGVTVEELEIENPEKFACELQDYDYDEYMKDCEEE